MAKGSYSIRELEAHLCAPDRSLSGESGRDISHLRRLVGSYRERERVKSASRESSLESIRALATEYKEVSTHLSETRLLQLLTPASLRVAVYRANPHAHIHKISAGVVEFSEIPLEKIPKLPSCYGFKGGAARLALAAVLGRNVMARKPRDWDIFRLGHGSCELDKELAHRFMPEDVKFGHGIEVVPDLRSYLHRRDLTLNQVALLEGRVIATFAAVEDTLNGILRATPHVCDRAGRPQGKITMKMLRLESEAALEGTSLTLADYSHNECVTPFDISLHLDRVITRGTRAAQYYLERCMRYGYLAPDEGNGTLVGDKIAAVSARTKGKSKKGATGLKRGPLCRTK